MDKCKSKNKIVTTCEKPYFLTGPSENSKKLSLFQQNLLHKNYNKIRLDSRRRDKERLRFQKFCANPSSKG